MPKFVQEQIQNGVTKISKDQGEITIMFCDLCYFDEIVAEHQTQIIPFLNNLFRVMDGMCLSEGVQKIETVGKTYMAACGLKDVTQFDNTQNSTERILNLSFAIMQYIQQNYSSVQNGKPLVMKIGIHYGRAYAGVIGYHKPQFSLIGDTVNTTSRVCSTGLEGQIILSEQAFQQLTNTEDYRYTIREVQAKGKGILKTFMIHNNRKDQFLKQYQLVSNNQNHCKILKQLYLKALSKIQNKQINVANKRIGSESQEVRKIDSRNSFQPQQEDMINDQIIRRSSVITLQKMKQRVSKGSMTPMMKFKKNRLLSNAQQNQYIGIKSPFEPLLMGGSSKKNLQTSEQQYKAQQFEKAIEMNKIINQKNLLAELEIKAKVPILIQDIQEREYQFVTGDQLFFYQNNSNNDKKSYLKQSTTNITDFIKHSTTELSEEQTLASIAKNTLPYYQKRIWILLFCLSINTLIIIFQQDRISYMYTRLAIRMAFVIITSWFNYIQSNV